jgi:FMN phosphatase YigB (HAD superfamily)
MPSLPVPTVRPEAAIFDLGDTLLRWTVGPDDLRTAAQQLGSPLSTSQAVRLWADLHRSPMTSADFVLGAGWTAERYHRALENYYASADDHVPGLGGWLADAATQPGRYCAFAGAGDLIRELSQSAVKLSVVSDTGFDIRPALADNGLTSLQPHLVLSHEVGACKPQALLFTRACELMNAEPGRSVMIGDNPQTDGGSISAGVAALILPALNHSFTRDYTIVRSLFGLTT